MNTYGKKAAVHEKAPTHFKARHVMISDRFTDQMNSIQTDFSCHVLRDQHKSEDERFEACALQAFEEVKKILASNSGGRELIQIVVPQEADTQLCGLTGLLKTAALENPNLTGQLIELEPDVKADTLSRYVKNAALILMTSIFAMKTASAIRHNGRKQGLNSSAPKSRGRIKVFI